MGDKLRMEVLAGRLASGNASQQERDELMAMMAIAMKDVMDIDDKITTIHTTLCEHCSVRKRVQILEEAQKEAQKNECERNKSTVLSKDKLPWVVILVLVVIIATLLGIDLKGVL